MPGVAAVFTADDLGLPPLPASGIVEGASGILATVFGRELLARDVVRFVGEGVAVVVADSLAHAYDAAEVVVADAGSVAARRRRGGRARGRRAVALPRAGIERRGELPVELGRRRARRRGRHRRSRFVNQRVAPVPMEGNGIAVRPHGDGVFTAWVSTQVPFDVRDDLADALDVDEGPSARSRPTSGAGSAPSCRSTPSTWSWPPPRSASAGPSDGSKPVPRAARLTHGRAQVQHVEIGARRDGTLVGLRADLIADMGAYPIGAFLPNTTHEMLAGVYTIPRIASRGRSVVTNATPIAPYRGAGRPEATALIERAVDLVSAELGLDPVGGATRRT